MLRQGFGVLIVLVSAELLLGLTPANTGLVALGGVAAAVGYVVLGLVAGALGRPLNPLEDAVLGWSGNSAASS